MKFRNTNLGILLRRWIARWMFYPVYLLQYVLIYIKLFFVYNKKPLVIVLTIGKVGSSSVYYSIKKQITRRIFHIHYISENGIEKSWTEHKSSSRNSVPLHLITSRILHKLLNKVDQKFYVITVFREPIQRKISSFFQNLDQYKKQITLNGLSFDSTKVENVLSDSYFLEKLKEEDDWIKNELKSTFNFEVYDNNQIETNGYIIERKKSKNLLVFKMETLNDYFSTAMNDFFKMNLDISINKHNDGDIKYYSAFYKKFKNDFGLKNATLDEICNTTYFNSFYYNIKSEIYLKWKKK